MLFNFFQINMVMYYMYYGKGIQKGYIKLKTCNRTAHFSKFV